LKKVAIVQSNYIPWIGYFDLINSVDEFILLDSVQYTTRDWRNRNKIKTATGLSWLTIPVVYVERKQLIRDTQIATPSWSKQHFDTLRHVYARAEGWGKVDDFIGNIYHRAHALPYLSDINSLFTQQICQFLAIDTVIAADSSVIDAPELFGASERLLQLCLKREADVYVSGPAAQNYLDVALFNRHGIEVEWMCYGPYLPYKQLYGDFVQAVSVIDMLVSLGDGAKDYFHRCV